MTDRMCIADRAIALSEWAELPVSAVNHIEDYEFTTPTAIYFVMDEKEANEYSQDEAMQWRLNEHWSRGELIADDCREHTWDDWFIYRVGTR